MYVPYVNICDNSKKTGLLNADEIKEFMRNLREFTLIKLQPLRNKRRYQLYAQNR